MKEIIKVVIKAGDIISSIVNGCTIKDDIKRRTVHNMNYMQFCCWFIIWLVIWNRSWWVTMMFDSYWRYSTMDDYIVCSA